MKIKKAYDALNGFMDELERNLIGAHSAQAAFFIITSFFPFMLLTVSLLRFTPLESAMLGYIAESGKIGLPSGDFLNKVVREITVKATPGALLGAAGVSAVWAASRCMLSIIQGLKRVYSERAEPNTEQPQEQSRIKLRLVSVVYVFALQFLIIVSLGALVFGEKIGELLNDELGLNSPNSLIADSRWLIGFVLLLLFFVLIYTVVPEKERRLKIRQNLPGATLSAVGWLGFTWLFTVYINKFPNFGAVYGSLAAAVVVMLWLYFCMYIFFVGAQFNVWLFNPQIKKDK